MAKFSFSKKYNRDRLFPGVDTTDYDYISLEDLYSEVQDDVITVEAIYENKYSQYGKAFTVAVPGHYVNFPRHLNDLLEEVLNDKNAIAAINAGAVGFTIYTYNSHNKKCYTVDWKDIDPDETDV